MLCLDNFLFRRRRRLLFVFRLFVLGRLLLAGLLRWSLRPLLARRALRTYQAKKSKPCAPRDAIHDGFILRQRTDFCVTKSYASQQPRSIRGGLRDGAAP